MGRTVTLVLIDAAGTLLGMLEPFEVSSPWWQEVAEVIATARERTGFQLSVLRLLTAERAAPPAGAVTYLAEVQSLALSHLGDVPVLPVPPALADLALTVEPLRAAWASPGGPGVSIAWARAQLGALGRGAFLVKTEQRRVWNLSATWRIESRALSGKISTTWLKHVPPFFAHEAALLGWLGEHAPGVAVRLLAADDSGRALLEHVDGEDAYGSGSAERDRFAGLLHRIQSLALGRLDELLALGVPDRRGSELTRHVRAVLARAGADTSAVRRLLAELPERLAAAAACGIGDTLVHGDFHPGNVRSHGAGATLIDWGDSCIGHPAFDVLRLTDGCDAADSAALLRAWSERWRADYPASAPERAIELLRPVTPLCHAAHFADICTRIEPTERPFHAADVPACLQRAAALLCPPEQARGA